MIIAIYAVINTYIDELVIEDKDTFHIKVYIPKDTLSKELYLVLKLKYDGVPSLVSYNTNN